jgi:hypothetical protein
MAGQLLPRCVPFRQAGGRRSGTITLWTILFLPILVVLFLVVIEGIHLWLARVELENALEAAALAAVKEWAESGNAPAQNWTQSGRLLGLEYAGANTIRGVDFNPANFAIEDNLGLFSGGNPNENATCVADGIYSPPGDREGTLIFGAITNDDPLTFDTREIPSCGGEGTVLVDATGQGNLDTGNDNNWGVAFLNEEDTDPDLRICTVTITLPGSVNERRGYYFHEESLGFADNSNNIFAGYGLCEQNDVVGIDTSLIDVDFFFPAPCNNVNAHYWKQIRFTFPLDGTDNEFGPCERFRFGIDVRNLNTNNCNGSQVDGDAIGDMGATVTIVFANTGDGNCDPADPARTDQATFQNHTWQDRTCLGVDPYCNGYPDSLDNSHILTPPGITNLPDAAVPGVGNNPDGQSYAFTSVSGGVGAFTVRAQARIEVPLLCGSFCGIQLGPYSISACATAMYDCELQRPRLIRVEEENYTCIVP